ncbi:MAG TPA: hypothetical protein VGF25_03770 [Thermoleophilaceae bacterium]
MGPLAFLTAIDLPGLGREGPDDLRALLTTSFVLLVAGFVIGTLGHIGQSRTLVAIGVTIVFAATIAFVLAVGRFG